MKKLSTTIVWEASLFIVDVGAARSVNEDRNTRWKFSAFVAYSKWICGTTINVRKEMDEIHSKTTAYIRNRNTELSRLNNQNGDLKFIQYCGTMFSSFWSLHVDSNYSNSRWKFHKILWGSFSLTWNNFSQKVKLLKKEKQAKDKW